MNWYGSGFIIIINYANNVSVFPSDDSRVTQNQEIRITEDGQIRVIQ